MASHFSYLFDLPLLKRHPVIFQGCQWLPSRHIGIAPGRVASGGANSYSARFHNRQAADQSFQYWLILCEQSHGFGYGTGGCVVG